jgi:hypothetical protein
MIKRTLQLLSVALVSSVMLVSSAEASIRVKLNDGPGAGNGGEFKLAIDYVDTGGFAADVNTRTFCVELSEFINFGTVYTVGSISTATKLSNKSLTMKTAALFKAFYAGIGTTTTSAILGVDYRRSSNESDTNYNRDARSLQLAIWKTMGWDSEAIWVSGGYKAEYDAIGGSGIGDKARDFVAAATTFVSSYADPNFYGVRILNLTNSSGTANYQDQLTVVPEPGSIAIWGLLSMGLAGIGVARRRS